MAIQFVDWNYENIGPTLSSLSFFRKIRPFKLLVGNERMWQITYTLFSYGAVIGAQDFWDVVYSEHFNKYEKFEFRSVEMAQKLCNSGADLDAKDEEQNTPLHKCRSVKVLAYLIEKGANLEAQNMFGNTPLMNACRDKYYLEHDMPRYEEYYNTKPVEFVQMFLYFGPTPLLEMQKVKLHWK